MGTAYMMMSIGHLTYCNAVFAKHNRQQRARTEMKLLRNTNKNMYQATQIKNISKVQ